MSNKRIDLTNQTFGSLTAIKPSHKINNTWYWVFQCQCGKEHIARGNIIKHQAKKYQQTKPDIPSCGCKELAYKTKHGYRKLNDTHPAYRAYRSMMSRCYNSNDPNYQWYGKKGVTVHDVWLNKPEVFIDWSLSNGWQEGLTIDKDILCKQKNITPHIYSPDTCLWVPIKQNVSFATNRDNYGKHPNIRLSPEEVKEIEYLYFSGEQTNQSQLARDYGVTPASISRLIQLAKSRQD